jgi:nucleoside-diphosphate-sugar epimerase
MSIQKIVVTGASGKAGQETVKHLAAAGYEVLATDVLPAPGDLGVPFLRADLTEYGEAVELVAGQDAVIHLANIPANGIYTESHTFNTNIVMNSNVFLAAVQLGLKRVVWASSETTLGLPFDPPKYAPVDEDHFPYPTMTYALSKVLTEQMAHHINEWSGVPFVGLRFSNIFRPDEYERVPEYWKDPASRKWNLFGYIDVRDVAMSCQNALEAETTGSHNVIIAAADTIINRPSAEVLREIFPDVEMRREVGEFETLLAIDKARELIGFEPKHSWRDHVEG